MLMERDTRITFGKHTAGPVHSAHTCLLSIYYVNCPQGQIKKRGVDSILVRFGSINNRREARALPHC